MALDLKPNTTFDISTGQTLVVADYTGIYDALLNPTGYGGPNTQVSSVSATRFIFGDYISQQNASAETTIVSSYEYVVGGTGSFVYDTKTYTAGTTFISMLSGTPTLGTCTITKTGRFSPVLGFLPTSVTTMDLTPSEVGENNTIFADTVRSCELSIYTTSYAAQAGIPAGTYLTFGVTGQTATISGVTYRINEVFTKAAPFTMTSSARIALLSATTVDSTGAVSPHYFQTSYYAFQAIKGLADQIATSSCGCQERLLETLRLCETKYQAMLDNFQDDLGLSISGTQSLLDEIVKLTQNQCKC